METSNNQEQTKEPKQHKSYDLMYYWKYSDGSYGSVLYNTETAETDRFREHRNKGLLLWSKNKNEKAGMETAELSFSSGITKENGKIYRKAVIMDGVALRDGYWGLHRMFSGYTKDKTPKEILSLFSLILSGYTARMCLRKQKEPTLYFSRAPIVLIRKNRNDLCGGFEHLERIAQSLIVDTGYSTDFVIKNPSVIPTKRRASRIEDCAYARFQSEHLKLRFPTLYRDTAILIHSGFFSDGMLQDFVERNKWCTVLLFNQSKKEWQQLFAEVDLNNMSMSEWDWDVAGVQYLMKRYVMWLDSIKFGKNPKKTIRMWESAAEKVLQIYNLATVSTGYKIKQGSEWDLACLQMASLYSFIQYLAWEELLDIESSQVLFDEWAEIMLPGSCSREMVEQKKPALSGPIKEDKEDLISELETLITKILEYEGGAKVYPLKRGEKYYAGPNLDLENHHWAFLSKMEIACEDVTVLKIRYKELLKLAKKFDLLKGYSTQVEIKNIIKNKKDQNYVHMMGTVRINFAKETSPPTGLTLIVENMNFLKDDTRNMIISKFSAID